MLLLQIVAKVETRQALINFEVCACLTALLVTHVEVCSFQALLYLDILLQHLLKHGMFASLLLD